MQIDIDSNIHLLLTDDSSLRAHLMDHAQWFYSHYLPTFKESMDNSHVTCGYRFLTLASFIGMDDVATRDVFEWAIRTPSTIHSASIICRNRDDIVGHKVNVYFISYIPKVVHLYRV